jgi:hypothetical protein
MSAHPTALRYGLCQWFLDRRAGTADGRAGLPAAEHTDAGPVATPTVTQRTEAFNGRAAAEYRQARLDTAALRERHAELTARATGLTARITELAEQIDAMPPRPSDEELERRGAGETATPIEGVRTRRAREHASRRAALAERAETLRGEHAAVTTELARIDEAAQVRWDVGAAQVRRVHAHTLRRIAAYETRLVRVHPAGRRLTGRLVVPRPELPGWAEPAAPVALTLLAGGWA